MNHPAFEKALEKACIWATFIVAGIFLGLAKYSEGKEILYYCISAGLFIYGLYRLKNEINSIS